jgi:hypothetical protein
MEEIPKASLSEAPSDTGKWVGLLLIAVLVGEGVWGLIVSVTNNLVLPFLSRTMGADPQSPLYLGKGDFNIPALFTSVLELCFAGIVAVGLNSWVRKPVRRKVKRVKLVPTDPAITVPSIAAVVPEATGPPTEQFWSPPQPAPPKAEAPAPPPAPPPTKPTKPKPAKEIVYNSVGEPIYPTEE